MYQWNSPVLYEELQIDQYDGEFRIQRNQKWMEQCEKDTAGIKVKVGDKTYLFHNTDKWHTFKKNGLTCLYNYKTFYHSI